jgi:hypothetical protein
MTGQMTILIAALATRSQHPYLGAFLMLVCGAVVFWGGFMQFRKYRILANAPKAHVRSMPMGLVHLHGKATGEALTSPLTGTRCFMFTANVEEWVRTRVRGKVKWAWQTVAGDDDLKLFYLDDGTGRVLVNPGGAEDGLESQRTFYGEIGKDGHFKSTRTAPGIPVPAAQAVWAWIHGPHSRKLMEKAFDLQAGSVQGVDPARAKQSMLKAVNAVQQIQSLGMAPHVDALGTALQDRASGPGGGPYRVTEKCFLAGCECVVLGTCAETSNPQSGEDRHVIRKGENEGTLLISTQSEAKIGRGLLQTAWGFVFLGGVLIVGAAALVLNAAGIF